MKRVVGLVLYIAAWIAALGYVFWLSAVDPKTALGGLLLFFFCVAADNIKCAVRKIFRKDDCDC
jgi:hypothetical protein